MYVEAATPSGSTSEMREFLARALPWPQEHDAAPAFVNIHYVVRLKNDDGTPVIENGKQKIVVPGRAARNLDEAVRTIEWATRTGTDVYVCMSSQKAAEETLSRRNFKYYKAIRRIDNVARHKSFYIDVDVKPEDLAHGYATSEEAVKEFVRIRNEIGLPRQTFVVASGSGGFHAHWCLSEPAQSERWEKLSGALAAAFLAKGFRGDTQCIVDRVRLLRPPGTFNHKRADAPQAVRLFGTAGYDQLVEALEAPLAPYVGLMRGATKPHVNGVPKPYVNGYGSLGPVPAALQNVTLAGLEGGLSAGFDVLLPTIDVVARDCPFLARTLATGGKDNANPLWLQTVNVALFCQDTRGTAHRLSSGHATYTKENTDALVDRQQGTKLARDLGWPRCATIASYGAPECAACSRNSLGKSPLNAPPSPDPANAAYATGTAQQQAPVGSAPGAALVTGAPIQAGPAVLAALPTKYAYDQINRVCLVDVDEKGNQTYQPLTSFVMEKPWLQHTPPSLNFTTQTSQGVTSQIKLPYEAINDMSAFKRTLGKQGMVPSRYEYEDLGDFMVAWIDKLRSDRTNVVQNQAFGWAVKSSRVEGFVFGGYMWHAGVPRPAATIDPALAAQYNPVGDLQPWLDAAKLITNQKRPALDAILACAYAAPLVRFTGQSGVLLSAYSTRSGIGKTTALKVAQAVWANPTLAIQVLGDTPNNTFKKMGDTKNLPLFWDELKTKEDTQKFANLAFQLSLGKEKARLNADTSYRESGTWQTLLCCTSNDSLLAYVLTQTKTTSAGLFRIFEYEVPPGVIGQISTTAAQLIVAKLNDNYGQAGLIYSQFLGQQHERVAKETAAYSQVLEDHFKIQSDERFWLALVTTLVMGATYANELGLTQIDIGALARFMTDQLKIMRNERTTATVDLHLNNNILGIVSRYLNEHRQSHTLLTNIIWRGGAPKLGHAPVVRGDPTRLRSLRIQIAQDEAIVRIIKSPWDDWLTERNLTPALINKQLLEQFKVTQIKARLGSGTVLATSTETCFEFRLDDPAFQGLVDI